VIDLLLLAGRIALIVFLYLFLLLVVKAGVGLVQGTRKSKTTPIMTLTIVEGPPTLTGTTFKLNSTMLIGRSAGNDVQINGEAISGTHARITPGIDGAILEDLGSTNGTFLNGMPIRTPQTLRPGDHIEIGTAKLVVDEQ